MNIRQLTLILAFLGSVGASFGQAKFKVVVKETGGWQELFSLVDEKGKVIRKLDPEKYFVCFNSGEYVHFAIFGLRSGFGNGPGWTAINAEEKVLFNVYNASSGEPYPDYLVENKIRIVDKDNLIGYADLKGNIIIKPRYEVATSFHKGKAIVGENCKTLPSETHANESGCNHSSVICKKYGYINEKGTLIKIGAYSFDQIMDEIDWKMPDE